MYVYAIGPIGIMHTIKFQIYINGANVRKNRAIFRPSNKLKFPNAIMTQFIRDKTTLASSLKSSVNAFLTTAINSDFQKKNKRMHR